MHAMMVHGSNGQVISKSALVQNALPCLKFEKELPGSACRTLASVHQTIECKLLAQYHFGRFETNKKLPRTCASLRGVCNQSCVSSPVLHWHPLLRWLQIIWTLAKKMHPFARLVEVGSNWFNIWFVSSKLSGLDWFLWGPVLCWTFLCSWHSGAALCQAAEFQETGQKPWNRPEVSGKGNPKGTWLMFRNFLGLSSKHVYICLHMFTYVYICLHMF